MGDRDPGLDILRDLDGLYFAVDPVGDYMVKFVVKQVPASAARPHGLSYSLTLHDETGKRIVGFDNAHAAPARRRQGRRAAQDHRHRLQATRPYEYRDAATLLADFWAEVDAVLKERGVLP
jgi:uncharacterized protein DUF6516